MKLPTAIMLLALASCTNTGTETRDRLKESYTAAECKALTTIKAIEGRCGNGNQQQTVEAFRNDPTSCLPYSSPRKMSGLWIDGFEYSAFFEGARSWDEVAHKAFGPGQELTWLSATEGVEVTDGRELGAFEYRVSRVELIGKRSLCPFGYGHFGVSDHEVIAERFIAITPLPTIHESMATTAASQRF